ncbi:MAG: phage tail length tape measure family protein, partial [Phenylobacterium sp.]|uniref:phage tail length tape measure family protein n=1 Tax=Phenylobacterium sp. TaxID=1871053 RepID=UPI002730D52B
MNDFAVLGLYFPPVGDADAKRALKDIAAGAEKVETATKRMTATQESAARTQRAVADANRVNTSALGQMAQAIQAAEAQQRAAMKTTQALEAQVKKATVSFIDFHDAAQMNFASQYVGSMGAISKAHIAGVGSSKAMTQATLNLSRQFADVGVQAAMGTSALMIAIMQGPQISDAFQMAKSQGLGFSAVLAGLRAQVVGLLAVLAPFLITAGAIAAVIGGPLLLATKELNDGNKDLAKGLGLTDEQLKKVKNQGITTGDVLKGTFIAAGAALKEAFAPQLEWLSGAISATYQFILKATLGAVEGIVKMFGGAIGLLGGLWKNFPAIVGDAVVSGANFALSAVEKLVNGAIGLLNKLIGQANALSAKVGGPQLGTLASASIGRIANGNAGAMADLRTAQVKGEAAALAGLAGAYKAVEGAILKVAEARIREEAGTAKAAKALRDHTKATKEAIDRSQPIGADMSKAVDLSETKATKLPKVVGDLKTIHDEAYKAKDAM